MSTNQANVPVGTYTSAQMDKLGNIVTGAFGRSWIYGRFLDAVTYVIGAVCGPASASTFSFSNDVAGGSALGLRFACAITNTDQNGNAVTAVPAQNDYGYGQISGYHSAIKTNGDDDIAAGDTIIMVATDGVCDSIAAATTTGTLLYVGWAGVVDVDAANTIACWLNSRIYR